MRTSCQNSPHASRPLNDRGSCGSHPEFYIDSSGDRKDTPHAYKKLQNRIAVEQRRLSHMKKGSSNYQKQRLRIAKLHAKAKHQRADFLHKVSRELVDTYDIIGIESDT